MQKWLDDNDILMCSTHSEGKLVVSEGFIKTLKCKTNKKMTVNDSKSYLNFLNMSADQCSNTNHRSIGKKHIDTDYSAFSKEVETNL